MTKSKKAIIFSPSSIRSTLSCGPKGKLVIQKTNRVSKRIRMANLTPGSSKSVSSECSPIDSTMSSLTNESSVKVTYKKRGSFFEEFMEGLDWRSFGSITYQGMKENGYVDIFLIAWLKMH